MIGLTSLLLFTHVLGLVLGVGAATVKLSLLVASRADVTLVPVYVKVAKLITRHIVLGLILLTASGIGFLLIGYGMTPRLVVKVVLVAALWVLGPLIDNVFEPRFYKLAPAAGEAASPAFVRAQNQYLAVEIVADVIFYVIIAMWLLF